MLVGRQELLIWDVGRAKLALQAFSIAQRQSALSEPNKLPSTQTNPTSQNKVGVILVHAFLTLGITVGCRPSVPARHQSSSQRCRSNGKREIPQLGHRPSLTANLAMASYCFHKSGRHFSC